MLPTPRFSYSRMGTAVAALVLLAAGTAVHAQGIFLGSSDIGNVQRGDTVFNKATDTYQITGGGADLWGASDDFHYAWQQVSGDNWAIQADIAFPPGSHPPNEKAVLMFRQSLDTDSPYADIALHADGHITLQWRSTAGAITQDIEAPQHNAATLRIERHGNHFVALTSGPDGKLAEFAHIDATLEDPVYAGIGVCAHDAAGLATVTFTHLKMAPM